MTPILYLAGITISLMTAAYFSRLGRREASRQKKNVFAWQVLCFLLGPIALWFLYPAPEHEKRADDARFAKQGYQVLSFMLAMSAIVTLILWGTGKLQ